MSVGFPFMALPLLHLRPERPAKPVRLACMPAVVLAVLAACSGNPSKIEYEAMLDRWVGANESALIEAWGPPDRAYATREIKYLTWERRSFDAAPMFTPGVSVYGGSGVGYSGSYMHGPTRVIEWHCATTFQVSHDGTIRAWQYRGNNCVSR